MNGQSIIAILLVAIAAWWIARRMYRTFKRVTQGSASGGDCGSCDRNPGNTRSQNVITLDQMKQSSREDHKSRTARKTDGGFAE